MPFTPQSHHAHSLGLRLITPAFLGDACQRGQWRTPPLKALLRQWWRVAAAGTHGYNHHELREAEGRLFGHAWLENPETHKSWAMQGQVRLRLKGWGNQDPLRSWPADPPVEHAEVNTPGHQIGAHLYLGYGPLNFGGGTQIKNEPAIAAGAQTTLRLYHPRAETEHFTRVLALIHWFGTVGGRARNGWGSLAMPGRLAAFPAVGDAVLQSCSRDLGQCLSLDWAHAIGRDERGLLIWRTDTHGSWSQAMEELARIKIAFRTQFSFGGGGNQLRQRHLLAYPVTNHSVGGWGNQARLANQLRFRVSHDGEGFVGVALHLPHKLPEPLREKLNPQDQNWVAANQLPVWQKVHAQLDSAMQRIA